MVKKRSVRRVQKTKKLAAVGQECPHKTAARDLAREFLESINLSRNTPESAMTLIRFTEDRYLPFVEEHRRISTFRGYRNMWRRYLKARCDIMLREFRTVDVERILDQCEMWHVEMKCRQRMMPVECFPNYPPVEALLQCRPQSSSGRSTVIDYQDTDQARLFHMAKQSGFDGKQTLSFTPQGRTIVPPQTGSPGTNSAPGLQ